jgi:GntR family transcriptional regulator / MocR family aminotransferase
MLSLQITRIVDRDFAGHVSVVPSTTGLHIAAEATSLSARGINAVLSRARQEDVFVRSLSYFSVDGPARAGIVLGYGGIDTDAIDEGLGRLRSCFGG